MKIKICYLMVLFILSSFVYASRVAVFPELVNPFRFYLDEDKLFITEETTIYIYSVKDYHLIKKFGKPGEGPGELNQGDVLFDIKKDHLVVRTQNKIVFFTKDGEFINEKHLTSGRYLYPIGKSYVGRTFITGEKKTLFHGIQIYDSNFNKVKEIYSHKHGFQFAREEFNPLTIEQADFEVFDNKIIVIDGYRTEIQVFDISGEKLTSFFNSDELVKFTEKDKEDCLRDIKFDSFLNGFYGTHKNLFKFPKYFPPIRWFRIDPSGRKLYMETYEVKNSNRKWLVFDLNGKLIKKIITPEKGIIRFYNGKTYQLVENEDKQEWELYIINTNYN